MQVEETDSETSLAVATSFKRMTQIEVVIYLHMCAHILTLRHSKTWPGPVTVGE